MAAGPPAGRKELVSELHAVLTDVRVAVAGQRVLLLADEPTGALDSLAGEAVLELLRARCDDGIAGVLVTHEARYAAIADRVVFLADGRVVDQATAGTQMPASGASGAARGALR